MDEALRAIAKTIDVLERYGRMYKQLSGGRFTDYCLYDESGKDLPVAEAKRTSRNACAAELADEIPKGLKGKTERRQPCLIGSTYTATKAATC